MDDKLRAVLGLTLTEETFVNPCIDSNAQVQTLHSQISALVAAFTPMIENSIKADPFTGIKIIPAREKGWIADINALSGKSAAIASAATSLNSYAGGVVDTYSETIGLYNAGADVDNQYYEDDRGTMKFNQGYEIVNGAGVTILLTIAEDLNALKNAIPTSYYTNPTEAQKNAMEAAVNAASRLSDSFIDHAGLISAKISSENTLKDELQISAVQFVLASQSVTWSESDHTAELVRSTGTEAMKQALGL